MSGRRSKTLDVQPGDAIRALRRTRAPPGARETPKDSVASLQPDTILTRAEVATWLKVRPRQVERLGIPCLNLGRRTKRYLARDVLAWLEAQRQVPSRRRANPEEVTP